MKDDRGIHIAGQFVSGKIEGQNQVLRKYGLRRHDFSAFEAVDKIETDNPARFRATLMTHEGRCSDKYFKQIFGLLPESLRPDRRRTFKAYDGMNNIFNLAYEVLSWKVQQALTRAKLEPYLGFLHSTTKGKPSLISDFQELYRYLVGDFIIQHGRTLKRALKTSWTPRIPTLD